MRPVTATIGSRVSSPSLEPCCNRGGFDLCVLLQARSLGLEYGRQVDALLARNRNRSFDRTSQGRGRSALADRCGQRISDRGNRRILRYVGTLRSSSLRKARSSGSDPGPGSPSPRCSRGASRLSLLASILTSRVLVLTRTFLSTNDRSESLRRTNRFFQVGRTRV